MIRKEIQIKLGESEKLPNGQKLPLWKLKAGTVLYSTSIEGDTYVNGPYFFGAGEGILHALNPMFMRDTIGLANKQFPPNSKLSKLFHFRSPLRLREYIVNVDMLYYDSRGVDKPNCSDVGDSNFIGDLIMILPDAKGGKSIDQNLQIITSNPLMIRRLRTESFHFCSPGKVLKINKSWKIKMDNLFVYWAGALAKGLDPNGIRNRIFLKKEEINKLIGALLEDSIVPSGIGDLPERIVNAISKGSGLDELVEICGRIPLGRQVCTSGIFFKRLWERDVTSIDNYFDSNSRDESKDRKSVV